MIILTEKKSTVKKSRILFYSTKFLRTSSPEAASQIALRDFSEDINEEPEYTEFSNKSQTVGTLKDYF